MLKEALQYLVSLAGPKTVEVDGATWVEGGVQAPPEYHAKAIEVSTLQALVDYLKENRDELATRDLSLHVESPTSVTLLSPLLGRRREREVYLRAKAVLPDVKLNAWIGREAMSIQLQAMFSQTPDLNDLLKLVGNMESTEVRTHVDDGISQQVTVRKHAGTLERELVKRVAVLAPWRTFQEVAQPDSAFVFRVRESEREGLQVALFEADGGMWRQAAIRNIAEWLGDQLESMGEETPGVLS